MKKTHPPKTKHPDSAMLQKKHMPARGVPTLVGNHPMPPTPLAPSDANHPGNAITPPASGGDGGGTGGS